MNKERCFWCIAFVAALLVVCHLAYEAGIEFSEREYMIDSKEVADTALLDASNLEQVYSHLEVGSNTLALARLEQLISAQCNIYFVLQGYDGLESVESRTVETIEFAVSRNFFEKAGNLGNLRKEEIANWLSAAKRELEKSQKKAAN